MTKYVLIALPPVYFLFSGGSYLHNSLIIFSCCGYKFDKDVASANSKSAKLNPGATVQPVKQNELPIAGLLANQQFAGTMH